MIVLYFFKFINNSVLSNSVFCVVLLCYKNKKKLSKLFKNIPYTCRQPLMMAYEGSESAPDNFGKFIHQFQSETKTLNMKLERILIKLYRQKNVALLYNQTCSLYIYYIYIYIYIVYIYIYINKIWHSLTHRG